MSKLPDADQEMPLVSHLTELRTRLLRCVVIIFVIFVFSVYIKISKTLSFYRPTIGKITDISFEKIFAPTIRTLR